MKLLSKLTNRYLGWSLLVMVFLGVVIYFTLSVIINRQMDERLTQNLQTVELQLAQEPGTVFVEPVAKVEKTGRTPESIVFSDTLIYNENERELEDYRQIRAVKYIGEDSYKIVLRRSKIESEDFLTTLALVTILGMFLLWLILFLVTRSLAKSLWNPFFTNLKRIEQFSANDRQALQFSETGIFEFDQLNETVNQLTRHIVTDFQNQKQFSEDVSHELQTPLAIISSRLENLLGNLGLNEHTETLNSIYTSVRRLSKLNKAMILLSKIENNQFASVEQTNLKIIVNQKLEEFSELIALKNLKLKLDFNTDFIVPVPEALSEILINNLLSNSINHTSEGGRISIRKYGKQIQFCNTGAEEIADPKKLFNRFYKADPASQSVGLGLAIVKKICDLYHIQIHYHFAEGQHCFEISSEN